MVNAIFCKSKVQFKRAVYIIFEYQVKFYSPSSGTSRLCTMNDLIGLFPSNPGTQVTLIVLSEICSTLLATTLIGANGSSITLSLAVRVSLPPDDTTEHMYSPTSDARTAPISSVPSFCIFTLGLARVFITLQKTDESAIITFSGGQVYTKR